MDKPTFIDLFCGCGGFTLGMLRAGFECLAAIDSNTQAIQTLKSNLVDRSDLLLPSLRNALDRDLTTFEPKELASKIGNRRIDIIVGGPPCQGFSTARQRDGANHGHRTIHDERRHLYKYFLKYVGYFRPKVFVMENVLGIRTAAGGAYFTQVQKEARILGYRVHGQIEDAWKLGVPQKRRRQLVIGTRLDLRGYFRPGLQPAPRSVAEICLGAVIGDLPRLRAGTGVNECPYDLNRRAEHISEWHYIARQYLHDVLEISKASSLTNHTARPHSARDLRDFALLREGESSAFAMRRGIQFEFPYDKSSFKDRYTRQSRFEPCSTIVAHLSKDGLMFIHPTQKRSLTPREAARVQSFPDWFCFPASRTQAYRMIGNAVPPLVSEAVGLAVKRYLELQAMKTEESYFPTQFPLIKSPKDAKHELGNFIKLDHKTIRDLPKENFLRAWQAILFLFPDLHPINALDHGVTELESPECRDIIPNVMREQHRRYERSAWPVALKLIGHEAWRRHDRGIISDDEIYCTGVDPICAQR